MATFHEISREVAKRFLHTVVVVDDKAFPKEVKEPHTLDDIKGPGDAFGEATTSDELPTEASTQPEKKPDAGSGPDPERLDARTLMATFAKEGLICAVIEPAPNEDEQTTLGQAGEAAKRADVVVLDWDIHNDQGKRTRQIISEILCKDGENPDRLRLIVIYTGTVVFSSILSQVREELKERQLDVSENGQALVAENGAWKVCLLRKRDELRKNVPSGQIEEASVYELPERIRIEFAQMTEGLVPNVALQSLATLRENTHTLLGHLNKGLDPAYVAHRMLLPTPEDAEHHAVELIIGELGALLHAFEVGNAAGPDALRAWLGLQEKYRMKIAKKDEELSTETMAKWVVNGDRPDSISPNKWDDFEKKELHKEATKALAGGDEEKGRKADHELAIATSLARHYGQRSGQAAPRLALGTIIKRSASNASDEVYLVCLQPRCDCVRISKEGRAFIFLQCTQSDKPDKAFHFVVRDPEKAASVYLHVKIKVPEVKMIHFGPRESSHSVIRALTKDGRHEFHDREMIIYSRVGQLKDGQAQRLANQFAAELARVGLNEYEWLRRSAPK